MGKMLLYAKSMPITIESWIVSFVSIVLIRIFFEQFSSFQPGRFVLIDMPTIIHYGVFYLATTAALMVILIFFAKTNIQEISAISILGLFIIWLAPIVDLISGGIAGHQIGYLFLSGQELLLRFATFFGGHITSGITLGIQAEIILGIIFCYVYVHTATKNILRAIGAAVAFYCLIFFLVSVPSLMALWLVGQNGPFSLIVQSIISSHVIQNNIHPSFTATNLGLFDLGFNKVMIGVNTIIAMIASLFLFFLGARKKFMALMKNSRPERIFHFFLLFVLGISLARPAWFTNWIDIQSYILAFIALACAWMFSVCQNDIYDETIDTVSNKNRPFISKELSRNDMNIASKIFLLFAFLSAYAAGHYVLFFTCLFLFIYFIYSNPPLRLKRFVILNSFLVGLACLSVILTGFFLASPDKSILAFPPGLVLATIVFFTAVSNVRDIKDADGDCAEGIKTLPVLLGVKKSKKLIAGIICFFFLLTPWYFHILFLVIPSIIASLLSWYFITEENYKEWKAFAVYMIYLIFIIGTIVIK